MAMVANTEKRRVLALTGDNALSRQAGGAVTGTAVGIGIFLLAYERGTFDLTSRNALAIGVLWALAVTAVVAPWTYRALNGLAAVPAVAFLLLGILSLTSALWGSSMELAIDEFDRCILYAALYVLALVAVRPHRIGAWCDGLATGITLIALLGLASRLAPQVFATGHAYEFLPIAYIRLSYPIGYWNALGVLVALATPFLLRAAVAERPALVRALGVLPIPALAATLYLTSSRSGFLSMGVGAVALILLSTRRWAVLVALLVSAGGSAVAISSLVGRRELVNGPLDSAAAASQRGGAAAEIALACLGAAVVYLAVTWAAERLPRRLALPERGAAVLIVVAVAAGIVAAHPVRRFDAFRSATVPANADPNYVQAHLLSGSGNGRWDLWSSAVDEFRAHPLIGNGAGSFQAWWLEHRPLAAFVENAHSLYLELLGNLGILGLVPILLVVATGVAAVARAVRRKSKGAARLDIAAAAASFAAFAVAAGLDWMWEVTAVTAVALIALALVLRSPDASSRGEREPAARGRRWSEAAVATWVAAVIAVGGLVYAQAAPLLAQQKIEASNSAARDGDTARAYDQALSARSLTPWAFSPYLQLALVEEQNGNLAEARRWIDGAATRNPRNWQLWVVSARIAAKQGAIETAVRDLAHARRLNPLGLGGTSPG